MSNIKPGPAAAERAGRRRKAAENGARWLPGMIPDLGPMPWTLVDAGGHWLIHIRAVHDGTWQALDVGTGRVLTSGHARSGDAITAAEDFEWPDQSGSDR
jgi:hypothetical protein